MFEPIGGSAPKYTGQQKINPLAGILAAGIMMETIGESKAAAYIDAAVAKVLREDLEDLGAGKMGHTTAQVGDLVVEHIENSD